jgi:hypothetical protein
VLGHSRLGEITEVSLDQRTRLLGIRGHDLEIRGIGTRGKDEGGARREIALLKAPEMLSQGLS